MTCWDRVTGHGRGMEPRRAYLDPGGIYSAPDGVWHGKGGSVETGLWNRTDLFRIRRVWRILKVVVDGIFSSDDWCFVPICRHFIVSRIRIYFFLVDSVSFQPVDRRTIARCRRIYEGRSAGSFFCVVLLAMSRSTILKPDLTNEPNFQKFTSELSLRFVIINKITKQLQK